MDVEITIKGSVICYLKNDGWHLVFVTDETHLAKLSVNGENAYSLRKEGIDQKIELNFRGSAEPPARKGRNFGDILNIAGAEMHGKGEGGKGKMKTRRQTKDTEIIEMLIPAGKLVRDALTDEEYYVKEIGVDDERRPIGRRVAASIKLQINTDASSIALIINGEEKIIDPPARNSGKIALSFDNFCGEIKDDTDENNDFRLYYDWFDDAKKPGRRFVAGKIPGTAASSNAKSAAEKNEILGRQGNCDPISVDDPPIDNI